MFTGIIEEIGTVDGIQRSGAGWRVTIGTDRSFLAAVSEGDSVAVDGVCLTVTALHGDRFTADASPETLSRSRLRNMRPGASVHLERPLAAGGRFGGHFVQGHVDTVARVKSVRPEGDSLRICFDCPADVCRYIVEKGSVAVNGVSLTVAAARPSEFEVVVVPYTCGHTNLGKLGTAEEVNIECDIIAKYVEKFAGSAAAPRLNEAFLAEHGYLPSRGEEK
jgi:riboflavin synthase